MVVYVLLVKKDEGLEEFLKSRRLYRQTLLEYLEYEYAVGVGFVHLPLQGPKLLSILWKKALSMHDTNNRFNPFAKNVYWTRRFPEK